MIGAGPKVDPKIAKYKRLCLCKPMRAPIGSTELSCYPHLYTFHTLEISITVIGAGPKVTSKSVRKVTDQTEQRVVGVIVLSTI